MTAPLVSVVIPSYNCGAYLEATLASVQQQTFTDYEIVLVDDGSTDGTLPLLRRLEGPRLRVETQRRRGPAAARNRGIERSTGRYIAFLDADDLWAPEKLAAQVALMEAEPALGMCFTDWAWLDGLPGSPSAFEAARAALDRLTARPVTESARILSGPDLLTAYLRRGPIPCWTSTVMVRRQTLDRVGAFNERLPWDEDTHLWLRLVKAARVGYVNRVLAWRRARLASMTNVVSEAESYRVSAESVATLAETLLLTSTEKSAVRLRVSQLRTAAGYCRLEAGDLRGARADFRASLVARPSMRAGLYWLSTWLPPRIFAALRSAKRHPRL
ncbi:MAG TPA: glycosyltransferase [Dehalococcoidia bacterium]|nr:glycosyltransferase [Dehalococcoidia bacterium]